MSDCRYKFKNYCKIGQNNGLATDEYCSSCNRYSGEIRGAGDIVHVGLKTIGIDAVAKKVENITGKKCGCGERRAALNRLMPRKSK